MKVVTFLFLGGVLDDDHWACEALPCPSARASGLCDVPLRTFLWQFHEGPASPLPAVSESRVCFPKGFLNLLESIFSVFFNLFGLQLYVYLIYFTHDIYDIFYIYVLIRKTTPIWVGIKSLQETTRFKTCPYRTNQCIISKELASWDAIWFE